jgi:hypothetical protein
MTDQTDTGSSRQDAISDAASSVYRRMCQAAIQIAEAGGADVHERPMFPGAISVSRYAEPLAGIRAAQTLADSAARIRREYTQYARAEAITWQQIGQALGLDQGTDRKSGYDPGIAAFEHFEGEPDFHYHCAACGEWITDRGPYESHPEDNERGHAEDCARFAAELAAWQAERDAWERGRGLSDDRRAQWWPVRTAGRAGPLPRRWPPHGQRSSDVAVAAWHH